MNYKEAQDEFIQLWGSLGSNWGISKAMAQIHAYLLSIENPVSTDEIMEALTMSRSNANLTLRALLDWGLVYKKSLAGDRKEYFVAEKDIWKVATCIMYQRKKRELDPMLKVLEKLANVDDDKQEIEAITSFKSTISGIQKFAGQAEKTLDTVIKAEENWFWGNFMKLFK